MLPTLYVRARDGAGPRRLVHWAFALLWLFPHGSSAQPDTATAPPSPPLARGITWGLDLATGMSISPFNVGLALSETGALGRYVLSSKSSALSFELIENANLVIDRTTPQFGFIGGALRHTAKHDALTFFGGDTIIYERLAGGVALLTDGDRFIPGFGAELSVAVLGRGGSGICVRADAYLLSGMSNNLIVISAGYVMSPMERTQRRQAPSQWSVDPRLRDPSATPPCAQLRAYQAELATRRKHYVETCQDESALGCAEEHEVITKLDVKLNTCLAGQSDDQ